MEKFIVEVSEGKWASGVAKSDAQYVLEQMLMYIRAGIEELHQGNLGPHDLRGAVSPRGPRVPSQASPPSITRCGRPGN